MRFFKNKMGQGAYLLLCACLFSMLSTIIYFVAYTGTPYYHLIVGILPLFGVFSFLLCFFVCKTEFLSALLLLLFNFISLMLFFRYTYLYLSEVFYDGVSLLAIGSIKMEFIGMILSLLLGVVLSNVGIYRVSTKVKEENHEEK